MIHDMFGERNDIFHDMFVHKSGLGRAQGTKNEMLSPQRPTKGQPARVLFNATKRRRT